MKLISKDMVLNGLIDWQFTVDDEKEYATIDQMIKSIEEAPTVEAIPIEWLEKWKKGKTSIEQVVADKIMMDYIHRDWEKENEI